MWNFVRKSTRGNGRREKRGIFISGKNTATVFILKEAMDGREYPDIEKNLPIKRHNFFLYRKKS
jgi:hypothetical protein